MFNSLRTATPHFLRRRHEPGTAPGTLPVTDAAAVPTRGRTITYGQDALAEYELEAPEDLDRLKRDATLMGAMGATYTLVDLWRRLNTFESSSPSKCANVNVAPLPNPTSVEV